MSRPVKDVVLVGRDATVWLTALVVLQLVGRNGVNVSVVELPPLAQDVDAQPTLPSQQGLHRLIGLSEESFIGRCGATYAFGQRFTDWAKGGRPFMQAYDAQGVSLYGVPFLDYWLKARRNGLTVPIEDFCLGAVAAKQGCFATVSDQTEAFSHASYGYHVDVVPYAEHLRKRAIQGGVRTIASPVSRVNLVDGRIASIDMPSGHNAAGDFFIDASGSEALLLRAVEDERDTFQSWSRWLPATRMITASGKELVPLPAFAQIAAFRAGWTGLYPLQNRTAVSAVYSDEFVSDDEMAASLSAITGIPVEGDAVVSSFEAGSRRRHWVSNCLAIGSAAVSLEPLDAVPFAFVQAGLSALTTLFPVEAEVMPEAKAYNDLLTQEAKRLRDFQIAHYALNGRFEDPYWNAVREAELPNDLQYKLDLFRQRGNVPMLSQETFARENWIASFLGHGLMPERYDPRVDFVANEKQIETFQSLLRTIALAVESMPTVQAQVDLYAAPSGFLG